MHLAVDTLSHLRILGVNLFDDGDRFQVGVLSQATQEAAQNRIELKMVKLPKPRNALFFCRAGERLPQTVAELYFLAFGCLMLQKFATLF